MIQKINKLLTVRLPKFLTLQIRWTVFPTNPVIFAGTDVSKYGPVPGVGYSCRKSVKKRRELATEEPKMVREKKTLSV